MTRDLERLRSWLRELGVTQVGMESTGVYWKPVHAILEGCFELIVANAHHIRNVPGRKTDVKDAEWTAELIRHGLVKPSFVPPPPIRELRDLVRLRRSLSDALTRVRGGWADGWNYAGFPACYRRRFGGVCLGNLVLSRRLGDRQEVRGAKVRAHLTDWQTWPIRDGLSSTPKS